LRDSNRENASVHEGENEIAGGDFAHWLIKRVPGAN
jgi:hypothetical protein